jgi:hypothetical protein
MTDDERCAEARKLVRIEDAFRTGDLDALRAAVDDPASIPNGAMPAEIGSCLTFAIYWSPVPFIRALLELGADPNEPADDGFPPLIAALTRGRGEADTPRRRDVDDIVRLLLASGADPHQRGINDDTALHMAVAERNGLAVLYLLDAGADPGLRTRIDDCETPIEMARAAGLTEIVTLLERSGRRRLRSGLTLIAEVTGDGEPVRRQHQYRIRLRMWLHHGEPVRWTLASGPIGSTRLEDDGATLFTEIRVNRGRLINGLFYGLDGMRVGGTRRLEMAPHLAYGERGVPGVIRPLAVLTAEVTILEAASRQV